MTSLTSPTFGGRLEHLGGYTERLHKSGFFPRWLFLQVHMSNVQQIRLYAAHCSAMNSPFVMLPCTHYFWGRSSNCVFFRSPRPALGHGCESQQIAGMVLILWLGKRGSELEPNFCMAKNMEKTGAQFKILFINTFLVPKICQKMRFRLSCWIFTFGRPQVTSPLSHRSSDPLSRVGHPVQTQT